MQNKTVQNSLRILNFIRSKGYIQPENNALMSHYKIINHALSELFNQSPIDANDALECMSQLTEISKNTKAFFSLFQKQVMDLYDWAATGDTLTSNSAKTKLLFFFANTSPDSVEQKNKLLTQIQQMPDWEKRKNEVGKVLQELIIHYDTNGQFNEDPDLSVLKSVSAILHQISATKTRRTTSEERNNLRSCAAIVKKCAPDLYESLWQTKFAFRVPQKPSIPNIKESVIVFPTKPHNMRNIIFSKSLGREYI